MYLRVCVLWCPPRPKDQLLVNYHPYGVHEGVFKHTSVKGDALVTKNIVPVESVYNEKRISVQNVDGTRVEYRLGAAILAGIDYHWDCEFLHLGQYYRDKWCMRVEVSPRSGRDLVNMAKKRTNVIPIIVDARHPARYWMLVSLVDVIFADVAQPDQARILGLNANYFLKVGGCCLISIKNKLKPKQRVTLEPFERDHACVVGGYRMPIQIENELSESWCMHACLQKIVSLLRFSSARILL
ncbi:mediator of RNA polymerase II transcription subunit 36a-like [Pyrus ussuriensis x Pyrus communis]|uniref:Mediator of RNA polymerase II transcription subunit 36a-like n=1 Tax=Pyrus ussuriensis x Pyrus communis TaxID=2448454 RepID=A0A5N5HBN1_9ROSA|nr:mediator of RNA polymerase II transcription subunit 36a-like [Pyrus ussuriensis x Pyrus communis]